MAVTLVDVNDYFGEIELRGLSSDVKPTVTPRHKKPIPVNTLFFELDTGNLYWFDGLNWNIVGGGA